MRARFPAGPPLLQEPGAGTDQPPRAWPPGQRIAIGGGPDAGRAGQTLAQIAHVAERAVDARPLPHDLGRDALREILCWRDVCAGEACPRAGVGMDGGEIGPEIGAAIGPEIGLVAGGGCWSERGDLNSRPPVPQTGALTRLRYAPCLSFQGLVRGPQGMPSSPVQTWYWGVRQLAAGAARGVSIPRYHLRGKHRHLTSFDKPADDSGRVWNHTGAC
jgi:hypothetical protein